MTQEQYNKYSMCRAEKGALDMPFLAGGYTQADWDILNGALIDKEWFFDAFATEEEMIKYINYFTKPYWA